MQQSISECPIESAMMLLSGRWPTFSHRILSLELRKLVDAGVISDIARFGG